MNAERFAHVKEIFLAACDLPVMFRLTQTATRMPRAITAASRPPSTHQDAAGQLTLP